MRYHLFEGYEAVLIAELHNSVLHLQRWTLTVCAIAISSTVHTAVHVQLIGGAELVEAVVAAQLMDGAHVIHLMTMSL